MSLSHNKDLARRAIGLWTTGSKDRIEEILAPDYVNHQHHDRDSSQVIRGLDAWKSFIMAFHWAFPDFCDTIEQQIAEGDRVATRFKGTQEGEIMGIAPTGRQAVWTGITIDRIADGRIVESWANWDLLGHAPAAGSRLPVQVSPVGPASESASIQERKLCRGECRLRRRASTGPRP